MEKFENQTTSTSISVPAAATTTTPNPSELPHSMMTGNPYNSTSSLETGYNIDPQSVKVAVSQQQQQEVYSILAMLQQTPAPPNTNDNKVDNNNNDGADSASTGDDSNSKISGDKDDDDVDVDEDFEGEYNSGDEDGRVLPDDNEAVEFSGGLDSAGNNGSDGVPERNDDNKGGFSRLSSITSGLLPSGTGTTDGTQTSSSSPSRYYYGKPKLVQSQGKFTELGSVLGPFFCLGQLGKGTFSSIHKCINMNYFHHKNDAISKSSCRRLAAAKVELVSFQQSGVLEAEATILDYLHKSLPSGTVPVYMGHYRSEEYAAIFMEYLPGEDMHQLREHVMAKTLEGYNAIIAAGGKRTGSNVSPPTRRMNVNDAVYLTADVMLPLLQKMHEVGVVHRDVKPSNCVRSSIGPNSKQFCMVDFGLSKSIIVPEDADFADKQHLWEGKHWLMPYVYQNVEKPPKGCYRKERKKADFRGTSMYASLRVHQCRDYCPRDDVWSLLYVFCDLVSGGLPWMQHAANRDRDACQRFKERIHGETDGGDGRVTDIGELLKGDIYHKAVYQRGKSLDAGIPEDRLPPLPSPLAMCEDNAKVQSLTIAFAHVSALQFWEKPNYKLIQECIRGFTRGSNSIDPIIGPIDWETVGPKFRSNKRKRTSKAQWRFTEDIDPLDEVVEDVFDVSYESSEMYNDDFLSRIPIEMRFRISQLDYNVAAVKMAKGSTIEVPIHRALQDWMQVSLGLLYDEWNSKKYEQGGHRTTTDGFKRECYLQLLEKCRKYAKKFQDFGNRDVMYFSNKSDDNGSRRNANDEATCNGENDDHVPKRRKAVVRQISSEKDSSQITDLALISKCIFGIDAAIKAEQSKKTAPPVRISFG